nr:hypothetical protein [Fodinibius sediminis]
MHGGIEGNAAVEGVLAPGVGIGIGVPVFKSASPQILFEGLVAQPVKVVAGRGLLGHLDLGDPFHQALAPVKAMLIFAQHVAFGIKEVDPQVLLGDDAAQGGGGKLEIAFVLFKLDGYFLCFEAGIDGVGKVGADIAHHEIFQLDDVGGVDADLQLHLVFCGKDELLVAPFVADDAPRAVPADDIGLAVAGFF